MKLINYISNSEICFSTNMENLPLTSNVRKDLPIKPSTSYQSVKQVLNED